MSKPKLTPELVLGAYTEGWFPMGGPGDIVEWYRPDPRCIIPFGSFHVSRSLRRSAKRYTYTFDRDFKAVMRACAERDEGTWITRQVFDVYAQLSESGWAHSVEAWEGERLAGGVYGVAIGRAFMAESMFHRSRDAGKAALWRLIERLKTLRFRLFDVQFMTPHLSTLGAIEIPDSEYQDLLRDALEIGR